MNRASWHHPDLGTRLRRTRPPTLSALTLAEVVLHLRLDQGSETGPEAPLLTGMRDAAERHFERYCAAALMDQEWTMMLNRWPDYNAGLQLPYPPLLDLISIEQDGDPFDIADFRVDSGDRFPAVLSPISGSWSGSYTPGMRGEIVFRCGYETADDVPADIKQALLMAIATWYENRESLQQFILTPVVELGWQDLLSPYREAGFA